MNRKPYRILCANCRTHLYWYEGEFEGQVRGRCFKPVGKAITPMRGQVMMCHRCGQPWYMLRENGSIIVMTDQGFKPSAPKGQRHVISNLFPELTDEQPNALEFRDPAEVKRRAQVNDRAGRQGPGTVHPPVGGPSPGQG